MGELKVGSLMHSHTQSVMMQRFFFLYLKCTNKLGCQDAEISVQTACSFYTCFLRNFIKISNLSCDNKWLGTQKTVEKTSEGAQNSPLLPLTYINFQHLLRRIYQMHWQWIIWEMRQLADAQRRAKKTLHLWKASETLWTTQVPPP